MCNIRKEASNVLAGRLFETLAFCVMYLMVIGAFLICVCSIVMNLLVNEVVSSHVGIAIMLVAFFIVNALFIVGKNKVMLKIINGDMFCFCELFTNIKYCVKAFAIIGICTLSTLAWSLLFVVPGIMKVSSYSMSLYILANNPDMKVLECIKESKRMMEGNNKQLVCMWLQIAIKLLVISAIMVVPYTICMIEVTDMVTLMFGTFAFVIIYPITMFVALTYSETMLAVFYCRVTNNYEVVENKVEINSKDMKHVVVEVV